MGKSRDQDSIIISIRKNYEKKDILLCSELAELPEILELTPSGFSTFIAFCYCDGRHSGARQYASDDIGCKFWFLAKRAVCVWRCTG